MLIRELGLDAETVTFKKQKQEPALPCQITISTESGPLPFWLYRDEETGKLKLDDEKPSLGKPRKGVKSTENEVAVGGFLDLEKGKGKWRQPDKQAPFEGSAQTSHDPTTLQADLLQRGFSELEAKAIVAQVCDGDTIREAAKRVGKSHGWVGRKRIQRIVEALRKGIRLPEPSAATIPSDVARTAAANAGNRWTLPEAMGFARREIDNYLPHNVNHLAALGLGKLLGSENRRLTEEQMEQIKNLSPLDKLPLLLPPGKNVADAIAAYIRLHPRALLSPNTNNLLVAALVDLLEAAHFGNFEHRFPGLLPKDNRKLAVARARKALNALVRGNQGNPREYPTHLLAHVVHIMQLALEPLQRAWCAWKDAKVPREGQLKAIRERLRAEVEELVRPIQPAESQQATRDAFNVEVERLTDTELQASLSNYDDTPEGWKKNLLTASARLAEKATGISFKAFDRAWKKENTL